MSKAPTLTKTVGFACPTTQEPHHFVVIVPKGGDVTITESFGLRYDDGQLDEIVRVVLPRDKWNAIAEDAQHELNRRIKSKGIKGMRGGKWKSGDTKVERILGKELCVLAWAVETAEMDDIPVIVEGWLDLSPEGRWWLSHMTAASSGKAEDTHKGWRLALRHALTDMPSANRRGRR